MHLYEAGTSHVPARDAVTLVAPLHPPADTHSHPQPIHRHIPAPPLTLDVPLTPCLNRPVRRG